MDLFNFDEASFLSFLLTLMRISLVVFLLPVFGGNSAPRLVKGALCMVLTLALWPHLSFSGSLLPGHPFGIALMLAGEIIMGIMLGLLVRFFFAGIQTGGELLGFQMGFTMVSVADPLSGQSTSISSHFMYMVSLLIFLVLDGHLVMLKGLTDSFALVPPGQLVFRHASLHNMLTLAGGMFVMAVHIAAPVMAALFLVELALALMGRAAPQMNLLMIGFPLKIGVGFLFMGLLFTIMRHQVQDFILGLGPQMTNMLKLISPL
ncbi:flagellar biosynthetic protein FliR [Oleidesulfovibrio alaskensis G20]|jgi:flagellar biosynthetic protein FliR|uniref:Flagellar biosynthetic protein FliR n=1 Tax=Oleidesulfovibrio alaskensis (strain ATCC BAA-1058 / DSM 17464 / G20) TaxID=207559 RepID=Q316G7_OLEA2|nr:flagellar biosynthetic protein FliR [Oleidesulfovibrio alaskensis]ABB37179.1 flagellar biosynthetic protein FliR [Oleidesulfovibrio alaskensis G20]MBG0772632.1 flagellar biosynthetic protein FliR [Oleidesulfovibrio alaskensis]MBL3582979.1 flagellar biosynthetic protein FliR [Oleidesulfovibrio alaskensis]